ncbi:MAG TPA: AAA family ATPase [Bryobacteraceae bacterium]|nr:AAA family ATPase [Bryobacteraceae bacterium]
MNPLALDPSVHWQTLDEQFEWIHAMKDCPQDPAFHAEGDVWTHVRMVCEALAGLGKWQSLPESERRVLFAAALLHDVAKPACTRVENGRITSRGHSRRGAIQARRILWERGADFQSREQVCALIRYHQVPFYLMQRPDSLRMAFLISQTARCDLLAILAEADALGRECVDQADLLARIDWFREFCGEHRCLEGPRKFASALSRFQYFRAENRDANYKAHDSSKYEVILMSGLPGAGKDTWIRRNGRDLQQISLDAIREETGAPPVGNQGPVVQLARERARELLRRCESFAWNATNLSQDTRSPLVDLFTAYQARTKIVYVEASNDRLFVQNRERTTAIPATAIERMMERWEVPEALEAHGVEFWVNGEARTR